MDDSSRSKLAMYLAVKAVCDARPSVWQGSEAFEDAFTDFCRCIENLLRLQPAIGIFHSEALGIAVELAVAERILIVELDELIEQFVVVDEAFVDSYTVARSMDLNDGIFKPMPMVQTP
jgi:hypothetical protein